MGFPTATRRLGVVLATFHGTLKIVGERRRAPPRLPLAPRARGRPRRAGGAAAVEETNDVGVPLVLVCRAVCRGGCRRGCRGGS